jgi:riboflavin synthase alpha subunit
MHIDGISLTINCYKRESIQTTAIFRCGQSPTFKDLLMGTMIILK